MTAVAITFPTAGSALPPGYGYEKVSPRAAQKGDADVPIQVGAVRSADDGRRVTYQLPVASEGDEGGALPSQALASLGADRWTPRGIMPPLDADIGGAQLDNRIGYQAFSSDLSLGALVQGDPPLVPGAATGDGTRNLYLRNLAGDGSYTVLTPPPAGTLTLRDQPFATFSYAPVFADGTPDFEHIAYETSFIALTPEAAEGCLSGPPCFSGFIPNVYEWTNGSLRLVSVLEDGQPSVSGGVAGAGMWAGVSPSYGTEQPGSRIMSNDGRRIVFTVPRATVAAAYAGDVYVRIDGVVTRFVSRSQRAAPDPSGAKPAQFITASDDGRFIFIASEEKLTDDSTAGEGGKRDLYRYDVETGNLEDLTANLAEGFVEVVGASSDGSVIYFGSGSAAKLVYVWRVGSGVKLVTSFPTDSTAPNHNYEDAIVNSRQQSRVSPDGRYAVFSTYDRLSDRDTGGTSQLYIYDAIESSVKCLSCPPTGATPTSNAWTSSIAGGLTDYPYIRNYTPRNFDITGSTLTFQTADSLTSDDQNAAFDVYQYDVATGAIALISPGTGVENAYFADASADGATVFFATRARVIPEEDDDGLTDLYVARRGAKQRPLPPAPPCAGDECQGPWTIPHSDAGLGTATFVGPNDIDERATARVFAVAPITARKRAAFARTGRLEIAVKVSDAGKITAVARGRLSAKRVRVLARASKTVRDGGKVVLSLRLSRPAREHLARGAPLRVNVAVTYSEGGGKQQVSLLLRRPLRGLRRGQN